MSTTEILSDEYNGLRDGSEERIISSDNYKDEYDSYQQHSHHDVLSHSLPYVKKRIDKEVQMNQHRSMQNISINLIRPPVDVLATYVVNNTRDRLKADLLRAHARFTEMNTTSIRTNDILCNDISSEASTSGIKETSGEWGWFADIDSSGDSNGGYLLPSMRRRFSTSLDRQTTVLEKEDNHILCDEGLNTRITAAHKTFTLQNHNENIISKTDKSSSIVVSSTISLPKFRIVQSKVGGDRHAEYLVTLKLGNAFYSDWRRYSEFENILKDAKSNRIHIAWKSIDTRWFNRLEPSYLHRKCIALEGFLREVLYESLDPSLLLGFLGGSAARVNTPSVTTSQPAVNGVEKRPAAQLPKHLRPTQPTQERELFEKVWAENFKRSQVPFSSL